MTKLDQTQSRLTGRCLCGACVFSAVPVDGSASVCHCETCRRWAGGALFSVDMGTSLTHDKGEVLNYASSENMRRFCCATCGAPIYRLSVRDGRYYAVMQSFDDPSAFNFDLEIFIDEKPSNYDFAGDRTRLTADEFWAMMGK